MGYMKSWELGSNVHVQVLYKTVFAFVDMDPPVQLTLRQLYQVLKPFVEDIDIFPTACEMVVTGFGLVQSPKTNVNLIKQWELS